MVEISRKFVGTPTFLGPKTWPGWVQTSMQKFVGIGQVVSESIRDNEKVFLIYI